MAKDKYNKGIGNRSAAGSGTWAGADEPAPRPMSEESTPELPRDDPERRELTPPPADSPAPVARSSAGTASVLDQVSAALAQIGDAVLDAGRFIMRRIIRPSGEAISRQWKVIREKIGMEDRLIDGDTYDPGRARDWEKFKKGKRSSSYLQDDIDDKK